jgi:hypothetical protein
VRRGNRYRAVLWAVLAALPGKPSLPALPVILLKIVPVSGHVYAAYTNQLGIHGRQKWRLVNRMNLGRQHLRCVRHRRFLAAVIAAIAVDVGLAGAAYAWWSQEYVYQSNVCYLCAGASANNSDLDFNEASWSTDDDPYIYLSLCHPDDTCYSGAEQSGGYGSDFRTISYGRAVCAPRSDTANNVQIWFDYCYTDNFPN